MVLIAIVGTGGLRPALAAIEAGKDIAVASKEILVMAGESGDGGGAAQGRAGAAGGQRAQRDLPVPRRPASRPEVRRLILTAAAVLFATCPPTN